MLRIMVALDQTDKDEPMLRAAGDLARAAGADLMLVNVFSPVLDLGHTPPGPREQQERQVEAEREAYLRDKAQSIRDVASRTIVGRRAQPEELHEALARLVREHQADILAVASKRVTNLAGVLLGSTAQLVLRSSPCPVLVVRPE